MHTANREWFGCFAFALILNLSSCVMDHPSRPSYSSADSLAIDSNVRTTPTIEQLILLSQQYTREENPLGILICENDLGKRYRMRGNFEKSNESHQKALTMAKSLRDTVEIIRSLNSLATNYRRMGILEEAASAHYEALSYCEQHSDRTSHTAKKSYVVSLNGIGNVMLTLDNKDTADSVFRIALALEGEMKSPLGQAINCANIGAIFELRRMPDSARHYYARSMEYNRAAKSDLGVALCHKHFGDLYEQEGKLSEALKSYRAAYELLDNKPDRWHWLEPCLALANVHLRLGDLEQSAHYIERAKATATELRSWEHLSKAYHIDYLLHKERNNNERALESFILSTAYADSLTNKKALNHIQNVRVGYERERSRHALDLAHKDHEEKQRIKNIYIISFLVGLFLLTALVIVLIYSLRLRLRSQRTLRRVEKARANFFTNITHEFRTPLTVILGFGRQLSESQISDEATLRDIGAIIERQGGSLLTLINQLLDISKIKSAIGEPDWRTGNIVTPIHMIVDSFRPSALKQGVDLVFAPKEDEIKMDFVPDYLSKVMRNLIANALKHTPSGGRIYITSRMQDKELVIQVADSGCGIPTADLPHIFKPFYQATNSSIATGTGIGLSLVKQIVHAVGGQITALSKEGQGSVFTITVPIVYGEQRWQQWTSDETLKRATTEEDTASLPLLDAETEDAERTKAEILIVEDNKDIAYYIGHLLQDRYTIRYAFDGSEALAKAKECMPDLILTDLMMPQMDGYELCTHVRASEILNHIPIIVITARSTEEVRIRGLEAGADAYLYKPFNANELNVRVEKLLEMRRKLREKYSKAIGEGSESSVSISSAERNFLDKLTNIIYRQMLETSDFDTETIAHKIRMSRSQLNRKTVAITGYSTASYILQIRISKAKQLLETEPGTPVGDIASRCGFADMGYFARTFKNALGVSPSQYRRQFE